jgi:hypothetical protein
MVRIEDSPPPEVGFMTSDPAPVAAQEEEAEAEFEANRQDMGYEWELEEVWWDGEDWEMRVWELRQRGLI